MKKLLVISSCFLLWSIRPAAQSFVSNVKAEADEEKVVITYDLSRNGAHAYFDICLIALDPSVKPQDATGAVGKNINAGLNKKIIWYYTKEHLSQAQIAALRLDVQAIDPLDPNAGLPELPKYAPVYAGLGSATLLGANVLAFGLVKELNARKDYKAYRADPTDLDQYNQANAKHLKAQWMMAGGGLVLAGAGFVLIRRIAFIHKLKRERATKSLRTSDCALFQAERWKIDPMFSHTGAAGIGLRYRF